ncbi:SEC14-like protein 4 [Orchesella cincta]|uniref:SEC14-like protein 4 n=1 Tax=Orchesella cincta TaxID=48709 RepID=A0A1D2M0L6_ORCCI|nr:SEC14-like protein 4 [Orchesella cincta]
MFPFVCVVLLNISQNGVLGLNDANDLVLSSSEQDALSQFKTSPLMEQLPEEYMKTDFYLIHSNWNIDAAETMLEKSLQWRIDNKISQIKEEDWEDMKAQFPLTIIGRDKESRPVMEMDIGNWTAEPGKSERVDRYMVWILEQLVHHILLAQEETGSNVTRSVVIADAENLGFRQHLCSACISTLRRWNSVMEANYPGFYDEIIIIKAPTLIRLASKLISPFLSAETRRIIKKLSSGCMDGIFG